MKEIVNALHAMVNKLLNKLLSHEFKDKWFKIMLSLTTMIYEFTFTFYFLLFIFLLFSFYTMDHLYLLPHIFYFLLFTFYFTTNQNTDNDSLYNNKSIETDLYIIVRNALS